MLVLWEYSGGVSTCLTGGQSHAAVFCCIIPRLHLLFLHWLNITHAETQIQSHTENYRSIRYLLLLPVCVQIMTWPNVFKCHPTYRTVLALHARAVESEGGDTVADPLDVKDTLVASLARLGLWQVLGLQGDRFHLPCWDQNFLRAHQLGTVLGKANRKGKRYEVYVYLKWWFTWS